MNSEYIREHAKKMADDYVRTRIYAIDVAYNKLRESVEIDAARRVDSAKERCQKSERTCREAAMEGIQKIQDDLQQQLTHQSALLADVITESDAKRDLLVADLVASRTKVLDELSARLVAYIGTVDNTDYYEAMKLQFVDIQGNILVTTPTEE